MILYEQNPLTFVEFCFKKSNKKAWKKFAIFGEGRSKGREGKRSVGISKMPHRSAKQEPVRLDGKLTMVRPPFGLLNVGPHRKDGTIICMGRSRQR